MADLYSRLYSDSNWTEYHYVTLQEELGIIQRENEELASLLDWIFTNNLDGIVLLGNGSSLDPVHNAHSLLEWLPCGRQSGFHCGFFDGSPVIDLKPFVLDGEEWEIHSWKTEAMRRHTVKLVENLTQWNDVWEWLYTLREYPIPTHYMEEWLNGVVE